MSNHQEQSIFNFQNQKWLSFGHTFENESEIILSKLNELQQQFDSNNRCINENARSIAAESTQSIQKIQDNLTATNSIKTNDGDISMANVSHFLQHTFSQTIVSILDIAKQAMTMIYIVDDALKTLGQIEKSIHEIEVINQKTKYLSLNATIEAVRAGEAGESFQVVASEVRELSNDTQNLATNIRSQVTKMSDTLMNAQTILQNVAKIDMSDHILVRERLTHTIETLMGNITQLSHFLDDMVLSKQSTQTHAQTIETCTATQENYSQNILSISQNIKSIQQSFLSLNQSKYEEDTNSTILPPIPGEADAATLYS